MRKKVTFHQEYILLYVDMLVTVEHKMFDQKYISLTK